MNAKILVAHGNMLMADVLREVLEREGYKVTSASDGHSALGRALSDGYDLLLIDRDLPGLDGEQVMAMLHEKGCATPMIGTCGDKTWEASVPGIFGTLSVPFEEEALLAVAEAALAGDRDRVQEAACTDPSTQTIIPGSQNLKRKHALKAQVASVLPTKTTYTPPSQTPTRGQILLIDADEEILECHRKKLVSSGYDVTAIRQGDEGFERGLTETYDIIITDLWLPGLDGFEMISGLKGGGVSSVIIVTTAYLRKDMVAELRDLGVRRVLIKPFPEAALARCALSTVRP